MVGARFSKMLLQKVKNTYITLIILHEHYQGRSDFQQRANTAMKKIYEAFSEIPKSTIQVILGTMKRVLVHHTAYSLCSNKGERYCK